MSNSGFIKKEISNNRINWVDQVKGITIFLVVYAHNFPFNEKYIYGFHMPLFIMISGFFHPKAPQLKDLTKRLSTIIIPYFIWSLLLYIFWFFVTSKFGESVQLNLSPLKNFIGIFYAQGDRPYMDWGIPMWFLPAIFMTFLIFYLLQKLKNTYLFYTALLLTIAGGFVYSQFTRINLPWSINIAMVALAFYAFGFYSFKKINSISKKTSILLALAMGLLNFGLYNCNIKIDMYRAVYGNAAYFLLIGISGSLFLLFFFKAFPVFRFLGFIGKFSLTILALQLVAMSFIKFVLLYLLGQSDFNFSEWERFLYAILQILLLIPGFFIINKYLPILNGGYKKI
ncbi:acyltransferase family protein [Flavobacterium terrisoli]|uniref:acyltransferase family protein n=1 Tax=Flavobacterium terrisoli TaxID=3242195 RepID=UPI002542A516|nr:acyltransferase family protein [Flavobacterium buctense]